MRYYDVTLTNPKVIGGLFIGVLLTFLLCALTMNAVGRAAYRMTQECRRQFGKMRDAFRAAGMSEEDIANPESWPKRVTHEGVEYPDYANCVSISTAGAQREMIMPSPLAIVARRIEEVAAGRGKTIVYGKGSPDHKATVVGDTVGDPFKDTSGPSLNILIKLISIVSVVFAGLIARKKT